MFLSLSTAFIPFSTNQTTLLPSEKLSIVNKIIELASSHIRKHHNLEWMIRYWYRTRRPLDRERTPGLLLLPIPPHIPAIWSQYLKVMLHTKPRPIKNRLVSRARARSASESTPSLKPDSLFATMIVLLRCNASCAYLSFCYLPSAYWILIECKYPFGNYTVRGMRDSYDAKCAISRAIEIKRTFNYNMTVLHKFQTWNITDRVPLYDSFIRVCILPLMIEYKLYSTHVFTKKFNLFYNNLN